MPYRPNQTEFAKHSEQVRAHFPHGALIRSARGIGDEWLRLGGIKLVCDGSISERTARLTEPYVGRPNDYGILVSSEEELYAAARKAHESGWQIGTHANGDAAIDIMLRIYERPQKEMPRRDPRYRLGIARW